MTPAQTSVVLLAAGRGARMRELTDDTPKALLKVGEHSLIEHHLLKLGAAGFKQVIINTAYLGDQIQRYLGNGSRYNLTISYSDETATGALETAGGLRQALAIIDSDPFLVINADIYSNYNFIDLLTPLPQQGRLVLVANPPQNPDGDFIIDDAVSGKPHSRTFSGIALYKKSMFADLSQGKQALGPILKTMVANNQLELVEHSGEWTDVGTPERLAQLNSEIEIQAKT